MADERTYEEIRYDFTDAELRAFGDDLAARNRERINLKEQRAAALAAFTASMRDIDQEIAKLTDQITTRGEMRRTEVMYRLDDPRPGWKTVFIVETNKDLRTEPMSAAEKQGTFGFTDRPDDRPDGARS